jgi:hypothetical protein
MTDTVAVTRHIGAQSSAIVMANIQTIYRCGR